jgi:hypothetical protein
MTMLQNTDKHVVLPQEVILREVGEEAVLLNLNTKQYFSLNPVGRRMLDLLTQSASIEQAFASLLEEYAVKPDILRADLQELIENLLEQGLVEIV